MLLGIIPRSIGFPGIADIIVGISGDYVIFNRSLGQIP